MSTITQLFKAGSKPEYQPIVFSPEDGDWIDSIPGEKLLYRVRSMDVDGNYAILETLGEPGSASPLHYHAEDEVFHVLEGTMTFAIAGEVIDAPQGTTVVIPARTPHAWKNRSKTPVRMLAIFTPGGVEPLFERLAGLAPDEIARLAESFGTIVVGPPPLD